MMNGTANVNAAGRSHYVSSIPVPRAASHSKIHTLAASPKLPPRQNSVGAVPSQRASSPRTGRGLVGSGNGNAKGCKQRVIPKVPAAASPGQEKAEGAENHDGIEGMEPSLSLNIVAGCSSPRGAQKTSPRAMGMARKSVAQATEKGKDTSKHGEDCTSLGAKKSLAKPSSVSEPTKTSHLPGKSPSHLSLYSETLLSRPSEGSGMKRPQSCPVKGQWASEAIWKGSGMSKLEEKPQVISLDTSSLNKGPALHTGSISFSSVPQHNHPVMATVAPFHYRRQGEKERTGLSKEEPACGEHPSPTEGPDLSLRGVELGNCRKRMKYVDGHPCDCEEGCLHTGDLLCMALKQQFGEDSHDVLLLPSPFYPSAFETGEGHVCWSLRSPAMD